MGPAAGPAPARGERHLRPARILTAPVPVAGPVTPARLGALVAADALLRRRLGEGAVGWAPTSGVGSLGLQHAVEQELRHEGLEAAALEPAELASRVRAVEAAGAERLAAAAARLGVRLRIGDGGAATGRAARTAFVRLFDAGLVQLGEQVVDVCPRCSAVVDGADAVVLEREVEALVIRLATDAGPAELQVRTDAPELLPGTVAVVVPEGHEAAGSSASVPVAGAEVPVLADPSAAQPALVVPAHDAASFDVARRSGLSFVRVVDDEGTVHAPGPLDGLPRYAARAAARELLAAEGVVVRTEVASRRATQCRWCGTLLVPRLGHHWVLAMAELEVAAADAVREGLVDVWPAGAREELLARAGDGRSWCVARRLWGGHPVPVTRCVDCGQVDVTVESRVSCGRCMGEPRGNDEVLDGRFVGCTTPLAAAGWPDDAAPPGAAPPCATTAVVGRADLVEWALPALALGLWLTGSPPFEAVAVAPGADDAAPAERAPSDAAALVEAEDRRVGRAALLDVGLGVEGARRLVAALDAPPAGDADVVALVEGVAGAFDAGAPGVALQLVAAALGAGVAPPAATVVRSLAAPLLGD